MDGQEDVDGVKERESVDSDWICETLLTALYARYYFSYFFFVFIFCTCPEYCIHLHMQLRRIFAIFMVPTIYMGKGFHFEA